MKQKYKVQTSKLRSKDKTYPTSSHLDIDTMEHECELQNSNHESKNKMDYKMIKNVDNNNMKQKYEL